MVTSRSDGPEYTTAAPTTRAAIRAGLTRHGGELQRRDWLGVETEIGPPVGEPKP